MPSSATSSACCQSNSLALGICFKHPIQSCYPVIWILLCAAKSPNWFTYVYNNSCSHFFLNHNSWYLIIILFGTFILRPFWVTFCSWHLHSWTCYKEKVLNVNCDVAYFSIIRLWVQKQWNLVGNKCLYFEAQKKQHGLFKSTENLILACLLQLHLDALLIRFKKHLRLTWF